MGAGGDLIIQGNSALCTSVGGISENRVEGSSYKVVGAPETYWYHSVGQIDELNAEVIANKSGYGDDRNDNDISKATKKPSIGISQNDIAKSVKNQTNNKVKLPDPPEKTGDFIKDHAAAVAYDAKCATIKAEENLKEQLRQQTIGKLELAWVRLQMIAKNIDNINCDEKVKDEIRRLKSGDVTALAGVPVAVLNVIFSKIAHDDKKKDTFDADAHYQAIAKNKEKRIELEKRT